MLPWLLCGILLLIILILILKIISMQKCADKICALFAERLSMDTNTLITISSGDRHLRRLARELNWELKILRRQRQKYQNGDQELKEAVTNISHDLRTPLTAISGYLELLEQEEKSETVKRYLSYIENRTEALMQLTEEMFRYTVILSSQAPEVQPVDLKAVLEENLLSFYGAMTEREIEPQIRLPEQPVYGMCSKAALSRVFSNILSNALKYSDGDLSVELRDNGEIRFANHTAALDEVQVGKLFNRFFTVETARSSTGLGLSIAKNLVEQMGGTISAEYSDGELVIFIRFNEQEQMRYYSRSARS